MFFVGVHVQRNDTPLGKRERCLKTFGKALLALWFDAQTINHDVNIVFFVFVELRHAVEVDHFAVDPHANKTLRLQTCAFIIKAALAGPYDRGQNRQAFFSWPSHHAVDHLADVLCR